MDVDEVILSSRSSFNRMRMYIKDKPHKYETKLYRLCCSQSAYCIQWVLECVFGHTPFFRNAKLVIVFEVYLDKSETVDGFAARDENAGPVILTPIRKQLLDALSAEAADVFDRFYTLLLVVNFYIIGTVIISRLGLSEQIVLKKEKDKRRRKEASRPVPVRGTFAFAESRLVPNMKVLNVELDNIVRRAKRGQQEEVACRRVLKDYRPFMGILSPTSCPVQRKLFLGFVDLAIVNAFIVHNRARTATNKTKSSHIDFLKQFHLELCQLSKSIFGRSPGPSTRMPVKTEDKRKVNKEGSQKIQQRASKESWLLKDVVTGGDTAFRCSTCVQTSYNKKTREAKT
ncbi:hypothetical protein PHPALM_28355 [Phytophthora palmivora]|uniref:PiggyBac transposable element-derived protein domain-containing protein n=1 Tax=Phytophthora palmivora TaxID=4796 RepID=A0A2P4XAB8_9STRA|nr:hypothetical protein PHPALM_28355 [Phytophthora palmivora]